MKEDFDDLPLIVIPPPPEGWAEHAVARVAAIHEEIRKQGIDLDRLADPVEILCQLRDVGFEE